MSEAQTDNIEFIKSSLVFEWFCNNCDHLNILTWGSYSFYGDKHECAKCEKLYRILPPWQ
jgi:hypothetical protein